MSLRVYGSQLLALLPGHGTALKFTRPTGANWLWLYRLQRQDSGGSSPVLGKQRG